MPSGHLDGEQLERYSMGTTPEPELAQMEEHLLICADCQDALARTDMYVRAMRAAAARAQAEERRPLRAFFPQAAWSGALVAVSVAALAGVLWFRPGGAVPVQVMLQSNRGTDASLFAPAPAGRPLALSLDPVDAPVAAGYRVEIVDENGRRVWQGATKASAGRFTVDGPRLGRGSYYARLYAPSGELLREYGLTAR